MPQVASNEEPDNARIMLALLESVERHGARSQHKLASDLGIALRLLNAYVERFPTSDSSRSCNGELLALLGRKVRVVPGSDWAVAA
jgi:hypothetical protein